MGKFSWMQGHHKQPSDRRIPSPDWFTTATGEPSRQALDALVKEHVPVGDSSSRARSDTVSSIKSQFTKSSSDRSAEINSRPQSRQSVSEDVFISSTPPEPMSRNLFSKGSRLLRRKTSRMTLLPSQVDETGSNWRRNQESAKPLSASHLLPLSPRNTTQLMPNISAPFDFQHVTHTDQGQFRSLDNTTVTELASEFDAVQAGQQPAAELKGIAVSMLPTMSGAGDPAHSTAMQLSRFTSFVPDYPLSPPPNPPPKDEGPVSPVASRQSRSVENFSRPTRSPGFSADMSPIGEVAPEGASWSTQPLLPNVPPSPLSWADAINDTLTTISSSRRQSIAPASAFDKPLPVTPTLVHAVSTADNFALSLRTAPLPQLPPTPGLAVEAERPSTLYQSRDREPTTSRRSSLRYMQTFPSSKAARRRSQSSGESILDTGIYSSSLASPVTPRMPKLRRRTSIGITKVDIEDWEDAIDYSWEHPPDFDDEVGPSSAHPQPLYHRAAIMQPAPPANIHAYANRPLPSALTPVVESKTPEIRQETPGFQYPETHHTENIIAGLQGLGLSTFGPPPTSQLDDDTGSDFWNQRDNVQNLVAHRVPGSTISKSSSQESINLSIASSIMGTHRSSNSSTSLGDVSQTNSFQDNLKHSPVPSMQHAVSADGHISDSSQDTVTTETKSVLTPATEHSSLFPSQNASPAHSHERSTSTSKVNVPYRSSSIAGARGAPSTIRQRSSTISGRPKNTRVSYSLFPASRPLLPSS